MTGEDVYVSAKLAMSELILSGCTTSSDHLYIYPNDVLLDDTIRAAREVGLRFLATRGIMTLGASSGGLPPDGCVERAEAALADAERLIAQFHDASRCAMLRIGVAPCSPFSVTDEVMRGAAAVAERHERVRLHTHLAENDEDVAYSQRRYGCRPGAYVRRMGWEHDRSWFAHCVKLDAGERAQFRERGMAVTHCPSSNLRLASGICPVRRLLDDGVTVALGVDGSASNDGSNLLQEARLALLLQRGGGDASGLRVREALRLATRGGAVALGWADAIGQIAPGFAADFVGWQVRGALGGRARAKKLLGMYIISFFQFSLVSKSTFSILYSSQFFKTRTFSHNNYSLNPLAHNPNTNRQGATCPWRGRCGTPCPRSSSATPAASPPLSSTASRSWPTAPCSRKTWR